MAKITGARAELLAAAIMVCKSDVKSVRVLSDPYIGLTDGGQSYYTTFRIEWNLEYKDFWHLVKETERKILSNDWHAKEGKELDFSGFDAYERAILHALLRAIMKSNRFPMDAEQTRLLNKLTDKLLED